MTPRDRLAAWLITGPVGHLSSAAADVVAAWTRWAWARIRGRDPFG